MASKGTWTAQGDAYYRQGNWKRRPGVATRHELVLAIDRLIQRGAVEIANGELRLARFSKRTFERIPPEERWRRADEDLRAFCQQMEVSESLSVRPAEEYSVQSQGSMFEATMLRSEPRRQAAKYVLRELRHPMGARGYDAVITTIAEQGGWEWTFEPARKLRSERRAKRAA